MTVYLINCSYWKFLREYLVINRAQVGVFERLKSVILEKAFVLYYGCKFSSTTQHSSGGQIA